MPALIYCLACGASPEHTLDDAESGIIPEEPCEECGEWALTIRDVDYSELEGYGWQASFSPDDFGEGSPDPDSHRGDGLSSLADFGEDFTDPWRIFKFWKW